MIRSTAFGYRSECGGVETLSGRFRSFAPSFFGDRRRILRTEFLKWNKKYVLASRRSLSRGLGLRVTKEEMMSAGLWARECHYLSLPEGVEKPLPVKPSRLDQDHKPRGWSLRFVEHLTKEVREKSKEAGPAFVACAWTRPEGILEPPSEKEWRRQVSRTGYSWNNTARPLPKFARLLGLSTRNAGRYLRPKILRYGKDGEESICRLRECELADIQRKFRRRVWLPDDFLTKSQIRAQSTGVSVAPRPEIQFEEKGEEDRPTEGITFTMRGKVVAVPEEEGTLYLGIQSCRVLNSGSVLYGPPPTFNSSLIEA